MIDIVSGFLDPKILVGLLATIAVVATVLTLGAPFLTNDRLGNRMKYVAKERQQIRERERMKIANGRQRPELRQSPKAYMQEIVDKLNLRKALESEDTRDKLAMAGFRGQSPLIALLFARVALPMAGFILAALYVFVLGRFDGQPFSVRMLIVIGAAYVGFFGPNLFLSNAIKKRQQNIKKAFPDALDLLLICVESGVSIEAAFRRVSEEIGIQSVPLAEELMLTTAELSYLPERRQAYENLGRRTGLPGVKAVTTALIQAERYGTPLGNALRVMAQENRDMRMAEAERKAAGLPPKLTVPMIVFFLPVLFVVILGPAIMKMTAQ